MSDDVFYTEFILPDAVPTERVKKLLNFLTHSRSVALHQIHGSDSRMFIVVGNQFSTLRYSECPLPGSHDFAAGWLAHEATMRISQLLHMPLFWNEGEWHKESRSVSPKWRKREKPPVRINWEEG